MAAIGILGTLASWGRAAWGAISGIPSDIGHGLQSLWHYASSLHNVLYYLVGGPFWKLWWRAVEHLNLIYAIHELLVKLHGRTPGYIKLTQVDPAVAALNARINALRAWVALQLALLRVVMQVLYIAALTYAKVLFTAERKARIAADQAEHAAMLKAVAACLQTVQHQAASGYNSGTRDRLSTVNRLLNALADRTPEIRGLVNLLVKAVIDLESIDNPVARFLVSRLLSAVVGHLGVDKVTAGLVSALLGPLTGHGRPDTLSGVERDVANRLGVLEGLWADFMADGGSEIEHAGQEWQALTSILTDAALVAFLGLAVADPQAWATGVADTVGVVGNDTLDAVFGLIGKV